MPVTLSYRLADGIFTAPAEIPDGSRILIIRHSDNVDVLVLPAEAGSRADPQASAPVSPDVEPTSDPEHEFRMELGRIEGVMAAAGISMAHFHRQSGIAPSTWTRWKSGATSPTLSVWTRVLQAQAAILACAAPDDGRP